MDLLILSSLYHYNSVNLFKVLFALEAKFYFREFVLEDRTDVTDLSVPCSWMCAEITDVDLSKLLCPHGLQSVRGTCLGPECNMEFLG